MPGETSPCGADERLLDHPLLDGEPLCVPADPQAVAALSGYEYDLMLSVGETPVATAGFNLSATRSQFPGLEAEIDGIVDLGFPFNLEALAASQPDLIIIGSNLAGDIRAELEAIAPTAVFTLTDSGEWRAYTDFAATALGLTEELAALDAEYEARAEAVAAAIGDPAATSVSVVRATQEEGLVAMNLVDSFPSTVLADVGLARPESQALDTEAALAAYGDSIAANVSFEQLDIIDADHLFVWTQQATDAQTAAADENVVRLTESPLWRSLRAVESGQAHVVPGYWIGTAHVAAHHVLDDLLREVAGSEPSEVAPNPFAEARAGS